MRKGFILRAVETNCYYISCLRKDGETFELKWTRDLDYAWFTESLEQASLQIIDIYTRTGDRFVIEPR